MSYILDALKKSEKERQREKEHAGTSGRDSLALEKKKHSLLPYFLGTALLLNASILLIWLGPWHIRESRVAVENLGRPASEPQTANASSGISVSEIEDNKVIDSSAMTEAESLPDTRPSREQSVKRVTEAGKAERLQNVSPVPVTHEIPAGPTHESDIPPPDSNRLYSLNELPSQVKQKLPDFSVSVFLYSNDPGSRVARINGQSLKEGQYLAEGLKLEEIVPDGVIFSYRKYRFHLRLK